MISDFQIHYDTNINNLSLFCPLLRVVSVKYEQSFKDKLHPGRTLFLLWLTQNLKQPLPNMVYGLSSLFTLSAQGPAKHIQPLLRMFGEDVQFWSDRLVRSTFLKKLNIKKLIKLNCSECLSPSVRCQWKYGWTD